MANCFNAAYSYSRCTGSAEAGTSARIMDAVVAVVSIIVVLLMNS